MEQNKNIWILLFVALALLFLFSGFGMSGYAMMGFGWIFMLLFWGVLIWFVYTLVNAIHLDSKQDKEEDAMEILKRRYAKGDIPRKEYEEIKEELIK